MSWELNDKKLIFWRLEGGVFRVELLRIKVLSFEKLFGMFREYECEYGWSI